MNQQAKPGNLFKLPDRENLSGEKFENLLVRPGLRVERIISTGQASPPGFWYDQQVSELVVLLSGAAELQFADENEPHRMMPGDWVQIDPHRRHRVNWTDPSQPSIWLAIHYESPDHQ